MSGRRTKALRRLFKFHELRTDEMVRAARVRPRMYRRVEPARMGRSIPALRVHHGRVLGIELLQPEAIPE